MQGFSIWFRNEGIANMNKIKALGCVVRREQNNSIAIDRDLTKKNKKSAKFALSILQMKFQSRSNESSSIAIELTFSPPQINKM